MTITIQDLLAAFGGVLNGISQAILALSFGFAMVPSALALAAGILGCLIFNSTIPVSFQAETIALVGNMSKDMRERLSMMMFAGFIIITIGAFGLLESIINFAGEDIIAAMMAGVGLILTKISLDFLRSNKKIGGVSIFLAVAIYTLTQNLIYTFVGCIVITSATAHLMKEKINVISGSEDSFKLQRPIFSLRVLWGALALSCLSIGGNIAFGGINASISGTHENLDHVSIYLGFADVVSSLFGGSPVGVVITPSAAAPNPKTSVILFMAIMVVILATKSLPKIAKLIPYEAIAGSLFVIGAIVTIPENLTAAFSNTTPASALAASVTMSVTAFSDPFLGLVAGIAVNLLATSFGLS